MRYITNQLVWRNSPLSQVWRDHEGESLDSHFTFAGNHVWQAPSGNLRTFVCQEVCIQEARAWIQREPFLSLVTNSGGTDLWTTLLSELLAVEVPHCDRPEEPSMRIQEQDAVLRLVVPTKLAATPFPDLAAILRTHPELCRWSLHYLRPYQRVARVYYDPAL